MKDRWHERVLANALGFVNTAFKPLQGVKRTAARGRFAGLFAVLMSLFSVGRGAREKKQQRPRTYRDGCHTCATKTTKHGSDLYKEKYGSHFEN